MSQTPPEMSVVERYGLSSGSSINDTYLLLTWSGDAADLVAFDTTSQSNRRL
jgi:hypothetical protein